MEMPLAWHWRISSLHSSSALFTCFLQEAIDRVIALLNAVSEMDEGNYELTFLSDFTESLKN